MKINVLSVFLLFSCFGYAMEIEQKEIVDPKKVCWSDFVERLPKDIQKLIASYFDSYVKTYRNKEGNLICKKNKDDRVSGEKYLNTHIFYLRNEYDKMQVLPHLGETNILEPYVSQPNKLGFFVTDTRIRDKKGENICWWGNAIANVHPYKNEQIFAVTRTNVIKLADCSADKWRYVPEWLEAKIAKNTITFVDFIDEGEKETGNTITFSLRKNNENRIFCYIADLKIEKVKCVYTCSSGQNCSKLDITPYYLKKFPYESLQEVSLVADASALVVDKSATTQEKDTFLQKFKTLSEDRQNALHEVKLNGKSIFKQLESKIS